ncbi:hypothetical protein ACFWPH_11225 [Nocardia sp. NPDC058499]|uniref:hypothetical protein n=1 Tax=Nocardia sp. NPDC058499 TaxID=3346530 RepID=UPI00364CBB23
MFDDPNLDQGVESMARRVLAAAERLETASLRVERTDLADLWNEPVPVTEGLMAAVASMPNASAELKSYAARVAAGECLWPDIEHIARPVPPEVAELKNSPSYSWAWGAPPVPETPVPRPVLKRTENVVGPSDWPDDFDEYPTQRTWLV